MSDHQNPDTQIDDADQSKEQQSSPDAQRLPPDDPGVLINGPQFWYGDSVMLGDTTMDLRFRIPQRDGLQHNVHMDFHLGPGFSKRVVEAKFKDDDWHDVRISGLVEGDNAQIDGQWDYKGDWSNWTTQRLQVRRAAAFSATSVAWVAGTVSGTARPGSVIKLVRAADKAVMSTTHTTQYHGRWTVTLSTGLAQGVHELQIREDVDGTVGRYTQTKTFTVLGKVKITSPSISLPEESVQPVIKGSGALKGVTIRIYISGSWELVAYHDAVSNGEWAVTSKHVFARGARYKLIAQQVAGGGESDWSNPQEIYVIGPPVFTAPKPNPAAPPIVDMKSMFEGTGATGFYQNRVDVYSEQMGAVAVAVGWPLPDTGVWRREGTLTPGPHSIFGTQTVNAITSINSEPFGIRVRPGKPTVEYTLNQETMTFSGSGHYDQYLETQIQFTLKRYPGDEPPNTPPNVIVRADGSWTTTSTRWTFGIYLVEVVQKIVDNASGWIESRPYEFEIRNNMPDVTDVTHTKAYRPVFSGKGYNGATVSFYHPGGVLKAAPDTVVRDGIWSSTANEEWGPVLEREVDIQQCLGEHCSLNRVVLKVSIPPLPPTVEEPPREGLTPTFRGTCLEGATVSISFSGDNSVYAGIVDGDTWRFQRPEPLPADASQTISVIQRVAEQNSEPQSREFTLYPAMLKPVITYPAEGSDVGPDVLIEGSGGVSGATMQLYESQFQQKIGDALPLVEDGEWAIPLTGLKHGGHTIFAKQERNGRPSDRSDHRSFNVVLAPPQISTPQEGGKLPRTGTLEGVGLPFAQVEIWCEGAAEPWLSNIPVNVSGNWRQQVTQPVGTYIICARQFFTDDNKTHESAFTEYLTYDVVPAAPFVETPVEHEQVGRQLVVSGFGVPGDTATVTSEAVTQSTVVLEDRTWSMTVEVQADGERVLEVKAVLDGFESDTTSRKVVAGLYLPIFEEPTAGSWVHDPVAFAGAGEEGVGQTSSWFNMELKWTQPLTVAANQWRGESDVSLPPGGTWCLFRQTLTSQAGVSDWAESARFEVEPVPRDADSRKADERS
ncbi:hypothetical protein PkoCFBP13504_29385 [Pseudomonas koreensis]|uniref:hypothetical protein n=1 Tax=Pseudomonas koreensis TaxID=198620 RepID=UPI0010BFDD3C|nr:hypothetical protein [Pseudomonas koreensis]TKJ71260.1 hypothetical protein PkoCFBP13504_29385 [Pseudomonas koreensis]